MNEKFLEYLREFNNFLKIEKFLSKNTCKSYEYDLKEFLLFIEVKDIKITDQKILYLYLEKIKENEITTQKRKITSIKQFITFCNNEKLFDNKFLDLKLKEPKLYSNFMEKSEFEKIKNILKKETDCRISYIIYTLYSTGMRISEFLSLKTKDFEYIEKNKKLEIIGKGSRKRFVFFLEESIEMMKEYLKKKTKQTECILNLTRQRVFQILKDFAIKNNLNIENIFPHSFRHRMLTDMVQSGANIVSVQKIAGHQNLSTIEKYTHVEEFLYEEIKKFHPLRKTKEL